MAWKILPGGGAARSGNGPLGHRDRVDPSHWQMIATFAWKIGHFTIFYLCNYPVFLHVWGVGSIPERGLFITTERSGTLCVYSEEALFFMDVFHESTRFPSIFLQGPLINGNKHTRDHTGTLDFPGYFPRISVHMFNWKIMEYPLKSGFSQHVSFFPSMFHLVPDFFNIFLAFFHLFPSIFWPMCAIVFQDLVHDDHRCCGAQGQCLQSP